ncbi:hypothetical protein DL239_08785 [Sedimentitalea sp. CY04]|uniref:Chlorhexidine efflux transporter domain-containing protein n=2 Tax=Parasedimentitalea denitrificans TaxID=2211118 RepID=A0ABX0W8R8_9RHOB|nr:hypothetical protein [Sedimentitalea sp. CY04]
MSDLCDPMTLRNLRERVMQTLSFEVTGIVMVSPLYAALAGTRVVDGVALIAMLSIVILVWSPLHNYIFDVCEFKTTNRVASDRPHRVRVFHAFSHEATAVMITCPLMMYVAGHSLLQALSFNLGLTLFYTGYAYVFHIAYDKLRPVSCPVQTRVQEGKLQNQQITGV